MFRKKAFEKPPQETENSEHCFIELKQHEIKRWLVCGDEERWYDYTEDADRFKDHPFCSGNHSVFISPPLNGANYKLLASPNRESHFSFHKELDAKPGSGGSFEFAIDNKFEIRLSIKINMSLDQLNTLLDSIYSNYHGVIISIPKRHEEVRMILKHSLMNTYVDIKDKNTHEWYRIETKEFNKKPNRSCQIL